MLDKYMLEAMDRTLRDVMNKPNDPFGGKIIILAGDFRQCLPVVPGANRAGIVEHSINKSLLWGSFTLLKLCQNMRVHASGDPELERFDQWTLSIGNGVIDSLQIPQDMVATRIKPNNKQNPSSEGQAMSDFCKKIFPNIEVNIEDKNWLDGRAILASTNKEVQMINDMICDMIPGENELFRSGDDLENSEDLLRFNKEFLNGLTPNGFPPHLLKLKPGMPLMLLRNINPRQGVVTNSSFTWYKYNRIFFC